MSLKTLRVCLFKQLPDVLSRNKNYIYLTYDKLLLFFGQNTYYDPYVISESMPVDPIEGYLYILFDGTVKSLVNDEIVEIARIEKNSQIDYLKKLGETYFVKADRRYIDLQHRTLQLPYHNGTYNMTVDMARDLKIDNNTVVKYDPSSESFYIEGEHTPPPKFDRYVGKDTDSVSTEVNDFCIHANVLLSEQPNNLIQRLNGGLYATVHDKVSIEQFESLVSVFETYKQQSNDLLKQLQDIVDEGADIVSEESILGMVKNALEDYNENINSIVEFYGKVYSRLNEIYALSKRYTDRQFEETSNEIKDLISLSKIWGEF